MKNNKSLILYNQPHKGLSVPTKRDILKIGLSIDEGDKKEYYMNEIKILKENNKKLQDALNSLSGRRDELKYLKEFRKMFTLKCMVLNITLTLLQCSVNIRKGRCKERAYTICKPRKELLEKIIVNP